MSLFPRVATLCALTVTGCAGTVHNVDVEGAPSAKKGQHLFFVEGESLEWTVTVAGLEAGHVATALGQSGAHDGKQVVLMATRTESSGLLAFLADAEEHVSSVIDVAAARPVSHRATLKRGDKLTTIEAAFGDGALKMTLIGDDGEQLLRRGVARTGWPLNYPSMLLALRAQARNKVDRIQTDVLARTRVWRTKTVRGKTQSMKTSLGTLRVRRFDGVATRLTKAGTESKKTRKYSVWITEDEWAIPVRAESDTPVGSAVMQLVNYQAPGRDVAAL